MTSSITVTAAIAQPDDIASRSAVQVPPQLLEGETYAGLILAKEGQASYHLILLPVEACELSWPRARDWAKKTGGDLPTLRELALLFANLREHFHRFWYWSNAQHETRPQLVWGQNFASGIQTVYGRPFRGHARAVRRVSLA